MWLLKTSVVVCCVSIHFFSVMSAITIVHTLELLERAVDDVLLHMEKSVDNGNVTETAKNGKTRVKRAKEDASASRYVGISKMPQIKMFQIFMRMMKNIFVSEGRDVGGRHPLYYSVPGPVVKVITRNLFDFVFHPVGDEVEADKSQQI